MQHTSHIPHFPITPSIERPLVLVKKNSRQYLTLEKFWLTHTPNQWSQILHIAKCKIKKLQPDENLEYSNLNLANAEWSSAATYVEDTEGNTISVGAIFPLYNPRKHSLSVIALFKPKSANKLNENVHHVLLALPSLKPYTSESQTRNLNNIREFFAYTNVIDPITLDASYGEPIEHYPSPTPFPTTEKEAVEAYTNHLVIADVPETPELHIPPTPTLCANQPTEEHPFEILIKNPICHSTILTRHQPEALYRVYIRTTQATPTKSFRQVAYAIPIEPNAKNPNAIAFPICPVKSTVASLYWDSNPESPTFGQPIVKASSEPQLTKPKQSNYKDPSMFTPNCKFCGNTFTTSTTKTLYCSPRCRLDFNAGKKFGEIAEAKLKREREKAPPSHFVRHGIRFPDGSFYTGAKYSEQGTPIHNSSFRSNQYFAKSYSPAKIQELLTAYPQIFEGCVLVELAELD
jgi:hypothetical protein